MLMVGVLSACIVAAADAILLCELMGIHVWVRMMVSISNI